MTDDDVRSIYAQREISRETGIFFLLKREGYKVLTDSPELTEFEQCWLDHKQKLLENPQIAQSNFLLESVQPVKEDIDGVKYHLFLESGGRETKFTLHFFEKKKPVLNFLSFYGNGINSRHSYHCDVYSDGFIHFNDGLPRKIKRKDPEMYVAMQYQQMRDWASQFDVK